MQPKKPAQDKSPKEIATHPHTPDKIPVVIDIAKSVVMVFEPAHCYRTYTIATVFVHENQKPILGTLATTFGDENHTNINIHIINYTKNMT
ncbi:hypothetical protein [Vibrio mytili]|uniref:hypothetical protein n=1 Tax=Vibrio mytili TaxID=50718 RepID=UPI000AAB702D|nr:hypothetical protein [Vibrio mytili]